MQKFHFFEKKMRKVFGKVKMRLTFAALKRDVAQLV
ncbi:MAG: hypothetical protein RL757_882 [Bacteroidota bacterium]